MYKFFGGKGEAPKNEPQKEPKIKNQNEDSLDEIEKKDPLAGLSLEKKLEFLENKKEEIYELEDERIDYYADAKGFEEKMISLGISEKQKEEIRQQIKSEGGEISQKIIDIRNKYGIEPTSVEILSSRMLMMMTESKRISDNLQLNKKEIKKIIDNSSSLLFNGDGVKGVANHLLIITEKLKKEKEEYSEENESFYNLVEKINDVSNNSIVDFDLAKELLTNFSEKLKEDINKNRFYKTPMEKKGAEERYDKVNRIIDKIYSELKSARQGEGRYAKK